MANPTISQILAETRAYIKSAEAKEAEITGQSPSTIPGAEHDSPVPDHMTEPDEEVADGTEGPASARTVDGAGDDNPQVGAQTYESEESVLNPNKKPADGDDAYAKEASAMANDILSLIYGEQTRRNRPVQKKAASRGVDLELTDDVLSKIAAMMLATDEGADLAERVLSKSAGAKGARDTMDFLEYQAKMAQALADEAQGAEDAEAAIADAADEAQGAEDVEAAIADAADEAQGEDAIANEAPAADDVQGQGDEPEFTEEEILDAIGELVESGEITDDEAEELIGGIGLDADDGVDAELSEEDIANALQDMIDSGEISEEDVQSLVSELATEADPEDIAALQQELEGADDTDEAQGAEDAEAAIADAADEAQGAEDAEAAIADAADEAQGAEDAEAAIADAADEAKVAEYYGYLRKQACAKLIRNAIRSYR